MPYHNKIIWNDQNYLPFNNYKGEADNFFVVLKEAVQTESL